MFHKGSPSLGRTEFILKGDNVSFFLPVSAFFHTNTGYAELYLRFDHLPYGSLGLL